MNQQLNQSNVSMVPFVHPEFGQVRTMRDEKGEVLFCASDVAKALGYKRANEAVSAHAKGTVKHRTPTSGGIQELTWIYEPDMYRLITKSKLPAAEKFEKWVFEEVLPSIRKTGGYNVPNQNSLSPQLQLLISMELEQQRQAAELEVVSAKVDNIYDAFSLDHQDWREGSKELINKIALKMGGFGHIKEIYTEVYSLLEQRASVNLSLRLSNRKVRMRAEGIAISKVDKVSRLDVIAEDKKLIEIYIAIVKDMAIFHGAATQGGDLECFA